ncbi:efflux RND transporter periplasmic adaptor subunit [Petralouisia muris]|uniref:Efflux RND transporter periplasmic adaptor subunit n=1 Tax=Petralouisia muris TaxID=3032872 RepID=A0AC61RUW0_9FIRM|nr:efflux RND transporter periplasmic adaptor subunit [Petralouisia muris]
MTTILPNKPSGWSGFWTAELWRIIIMKINGFKLRKTQEGKSMKKRKKIWKIVIPVAVVAVIICIMGINTARNAQEVITNAMKVESITVEKGNVSETVETNGTVVSGEQKTIFSPVNAEVETADFQTGDLVKEGQKLVTFDLKDLEDQNQKAELTVKANQLGYQDTVNKSNEAAVRQAQAQAQVNSLQGQVDAKNQEIADLTAAISGEAKAQEEATKQEQEELKAQQKELQKELKKAEKALEKSKAAYDKAVMEQQTAQVNFDAAAASGNEEGLEAAREALNGANEKLAETKAAYEAAQELVNNLNTQAAALQPQSADLTLGAVAGTTELQQKLEAAQAELAELQAKLEGQKSLAEADAGTLSSAARAQMQTNNNLAELESKSLEELILQGQQGISAEFNGVISDKQVVEGATVSQGMQLFTLQSIDNVNVEITLSKNVYDKVKEGQKAEITFAGNTYEGTVSRISRIAENGMAGTNQAAVAAAGIQATVHLDHPDDNIFLGVDAKVKILAAEAKDVVILPIEAVNIGKDGTFCWINEDGILAKRAITTGVTSDECAEITEGIEEGEQVIADPGNHEEGDMITVTEQEQLKEQE